MSSAGSRSPSPLPDRITPSLPSRDKRKKEKKKKTQPEVEYTSHGKNEGTSSYWAYEPPKDAEVMDHDVDCENLDWDAIRDDENLELWLVRVPERVKPSHLESLQLDDPSSSRTGIIGSLKRKSAAYEVWSLGQGTGDSLAIGGEELKSLSCLLPRKRKGGKLYPAPKPIARHVVITSRAPIPSPVELPQSTTAPNIYQNPPRPSYPEEVLKHQFKPYGSVVIPDNHPSAEGNQDVDMVQARDDSEEAVEAAVAVPRKEKKEKKEKKRKGEEGTISPNKLKKLKTDS
ncbi:hypothetical protein PUNSTDRAFT_104136 [Punctularia strigosozonata HHB-11173 SS5]|uniref:uncharacterized protein n=1 Tax=Punctularia strigosozonata (strain HHB-11173) TaxID=741275 RepID=UPI0004416497|nr:uncharacterized protein PUNSTDRAFT_104136 [Punctularia strigosozonata HHB-11173 SS5]EIN07967.1 hypothetical protein PUNSTDRAFT_104136 [Punctularia strigosozonata HHB-11173 SS5]